jgi:LPS-assembly protein
MRGGLNELVASRALRHVDIEPMRPVGITVAANSERPRHEPRGWVLLPAARPLSFPGSLLLLLSLAVLGVVLLPVTARAQEEPGQEAQQQRELDLAMFPGMEDVTMQYDGAWTVEVLPEGGIQWHITGYVDINDEARGFRVQADEITINLTDYTFEALGNVVFEQEEVLIRGSRMSGDIDAGTGEVENATGVGAGDVYFRGDIIRQVETGLYRIEGGVVSPCKQALPIWEFRARTVTLQPGDHASMTWPVFKVKGVPLIVLPALYWPLEEDQRSTGFLLPAIGSSSLRGFMFSQSFFWAISRSTDATFNFDYFSKAGQGFGTEFRHALGATASGQARFYWLRGTRYTDEEIDQGAQPVPGGWTLTGSHHQYLGQLFLLNVNANFFSSQEFVRGFETDVRRLLNRSSTVGGYLTRSWSVYNLNLVTDSSRTYFNRDSVLRQRLPEAEFRIRRAPLTGPLYFTMQSSYARLVREELDRKGTVTGGNYTRIDGFPEISAQFSQLPWLTFSPYLNWRSTYYSQRSILGEFVPEALTRNVYAMGVDVVGPSFFRIFDTPASEYSPRYKNLIEPRLSYVRLEELNRDEFPGQTIQFDEIDVYGGYRHFLRLSLTSRLLAKRYPSRNAEERSVWEVFSVEFARDVDLRTRITESEYPTIPLPYSLTARVTPTQGINFSSRASFTPDFTFGGFNVSGNLRYTNGNANITWIRSVRTFPDPEDPSRVAVEGLSRLTGGGSVNLLNRLVTVRGNVSLDVSAGTLTAFMVSGQWNTQCCSSGGQYNYYEFSFRSEQQFSVILELLNVGTFGFGDDDRR